MSKWIEELKELDSLKNHKNNLQVVLEAYLTSDYANSCKQRTQVIVLFNHLQKIE